MLTAVFTVRTREGCVYRYRVQFATVRDEPYPPGGMLRIMRDPDGRIVAGPHVDELLTWEIRPVF